MPKERSKVPHIRGGAREGKRERREENLDRSSGHSLASIVFLLYVSVVLSAEVYW